jgi:hypothetical protein
MDRLDIPESLHEKIIHDMAMITILAFIKENEKERIGLSKDGVAKAMHDKDICSRPTTIKIIDSLLQAEILLDQGRGTKNASDLVVNKNFPYEKLMQQSFAEYVKRLKKDIEPFKSLIDKDKGKRRIYLDVD